MEDLIAADDVIGTEVFNREGRRLGRIANIMIDKRSGKSLYVVLRCGGFLGLGESHHPLPWAKLHYDEGLHGYVANLSEEMLSRAPTWGRSGRLEPAGTMTHSVMD